MEKKHIVCFGDSNTHGYCAGTGGRYDEDTRWTCLLQKSLGERFLILEEGLGGRTTCFDDPAHEGLKGLDYITPCLLSHKPIDLLVIMLGTNDTKERFGCSPESLGSCMARLIQKAAFTPDCWRNNQPNILIVTPKSIEKEYEHSTAAETMGRGCAEKSAGLAHWYPLIAERTGCHYFDANTAVKSYDPIDFMHLDEEGHRCLAKALALVIREIFYSADS